MKRALALGAIVVLILLAGALLRVKRGIENAPPLSSLAQAVRAGDEAAIRSLLDSGADPNSERGGRGWTPLMHAIHRHRLDAIRILIEGGADVNQPNGSGLTPLMMAASYGYNDILELLLRWGADPYATNRAGLTALDFAMLGADDIDRFTLFTCQVDTVSILRERAPEINPRGKPADRLIRFLKHCRY